MRHAKAGDAAAFGELYRTCYVPVYRYALIRTGAAADAEDVAQGTFMRAYAALGRFVASDVSPLAYLFTIARNLIIDRSRRRPTTSLETDDGETIDVPDAAPPIDESVDLKIAGARAMEEVGRLPAVSRDVVLWRFVDGLSNGEIAEVLGKTEAAVRQIHSRAIKRIRAGLARTFPRV
jgi:RNA polymerase sigma-70 factor (ECF subfamily)